jgi:hypothetical protein
VQRTPHAAFGLDLDPVLAIREQPGVREDFDVERGDPVKIIDAIGMDRLFQEFRPHDHDYPLARSPR